MAYFLGVYGADLFYLEKKQQASWQLVLTLAIIPCMVIAYVCLIFSWLIVPLIIAIPLMFAGLGCSIGSGVWCVVRVVRILAGMETDAQGLKVLDWQIK